MIPDYNALDFWGFEFPIIAGLAVLTLAALACFIVFTWRESGRKMRLAEHRHQQLAAGILEMPRTIKGLPPVRIRTIR